MVVHRIEEVQNLFFANAETHARFCLAFKITELDTDIQTFFVKVRSSFVIIKNFKLVCDLRVCFQTAFDIIGSLGLFGMHEIAGKSTEGLLGRLELAFLSFVKVVLLLQFFGWFDLAGRALGGDVEEVDVCV